MTKLLNIIGISNKLLKSLQFSILLLSCCSCVTYGNNYPCFSKRIRLNIFMGAL